MSLHPKDPRLTAYAFGELTGAERTEVETYLATSAEGRAAVEELRALSGDLSAAYAADLSGPVPGPVSTWRKYWPIIGGVAVGLLFAIWLRLPSSSVAPSTAAFVKNERPAKVILDPPPAARGEFREIDIDVPMEGIQVPEGVKRLAVSNMIWAHVGDLRGCYSAAGESGVVQAAFSIAIESGRAKSVSAAGGGSSKLTGCLVEKIRTWDLNGLSGNVGFAVKLGI